MAKRQRSKQRYEYKKITKDSGSEDDGEEVELFVKNKTPRKDILTTDKEIEEGDTLQSLAIRYHCTIEELKRLNNIHKDNEIFAKRIIKVPHRPFTLALAGVHISGNSSPERDPGPSKPIDAYLLNSKLNTTLVSLPADEKLNEVKEIIFNSNIKKSEPPSREEMIDDSIILDEEEILFLPQRQTSVGETIVSTLSCNGADCDIPWIPLVVCILIGIVAIPLIYVLYIAEHPQQYQHKDVS